MDKKLIVPIEIKEGYKKCICGADNNFGHLSYEDDEVKLFFNLIFNAHSGWIVCCTKCENIGLVDD